MSFVTILSNRIHKHLLHNFVLSKYVGTKTVKRVLITGPDVYFSLNSKQQDDESDKDFGTNYHRWLQFLFPYVFVLQTHHTLPTGYTL